MSIRQNYHLLLAVTAIFIMLAVSCNRVDNSAAIERHKKLAGELRDTRLYHAAIEEYETLLSYPDVDEQTRGNVNYLIARIYFENLMDYEKAAAYYVRARSIDPNGSYVNEASKNLVASLEKLGRTLDAKRQLSNAVDIDAPLKQEGDVAIARVGGQKIWLSQIENELQSLPVEIQKQFSSRQAKIDYAHQYVAMELIYRAALREGYDRDAEIMKQKRMLERKLLIDKYILDNVMNEVTIDTSDVRNFYLANRDEKYNSAPYDSVRAQVFIDYQNQKAGSAFNDYIARLSKSENVEFYDQNIK